MKICTITTKTWSTYIKKDGQYIFQQGLLGDLHYVLKKYFNATFPKQMGRGTLLLNGSWTGCLGELQRGDCDVTLMPYLAIFSTDKVLDTTTPFLYTSSTIVSGRPVIEQTQYSTFIVDIFNPDIWYYTVASFIVLALAAAISEYLIYPKKKLLQQINIYVTSFFGLVFFQSIPYLPKRKSAKIFAISWIIGVTFLQLLYKGIFKANLSSISSTGIDSLSDLLKYPDLTPFTMIDSSFEEHIKTNPEVYKVLRSKNGLHSMKDVLSLEIMKRVNNREAAYIFDLITISGTVGRICRQNKTFQFYLSENHLYGMPLTLAVRKNLSSDVLIDLNKKLSMLFDTSQITPKLNQLNYAANPCIWKAENNIAIRMRLAQQQLLLIFFAVGIVLSTIILIGEIAFGAFKRKNKNEKKKKC